MEKKSKDTMTEILTAITAFICVTALFVLVILPLISGVSEKKHKASGETGADSILQTGAYFWAQGGEIVYHMKSIEEDMHTLNYYFSSTAPQTIYNRYYYMESQSQTNRVTYFKDFNGDNDTPGEPYEEILYRGLYNTSIRLITPRNNEDTASYKWVLESATLQIKGRKVIDLDYFLNSIRETTIAIFGKSTRAIGQITLVNLDTGRAELSGIGLDVEYTEGEYSHLSGNALADVIESRIGNYARNGDNGRRYIVLDTLFLNFTTTLSPAEYINPIQFYIDYTPNNYKVDNNTVVLSTEKAPFAINWNGEIGLFGFIDEFFNTELFPGFSFGTLLFIAVGGLLVGMLLKIFLGG